MKTPYIKKIVLPTYKASLWIVIHPSIPKAIEYIEDSISTRILASKDRRGTRAYTFAYEDDHAKRRFILFLKPSAKAGEIAHECKHLLNIIFRWYGVKLSISNDENECYYLEDLVDRVHLSLKRVKNKKKSVELLASNEIIV